MEKTITYFEKPGIENTDALFGLVKERLEGSDIKYVKKDWKALILNM